MIKEIISEIQLLIEEIYKKVYDIYKDNLDADDIKQFIVHIRYYEIMLQELEEKHLYEDESNTQKILIEIKKEIKNINLNLV